jgi:hypothetical protein
MANAKVISRQKSRIDRSKAVQYALVALVAIIVIITILYQPGAAARQQNSTLPTNTPTTFATLNTSANYTTTTVAYNVTNSTTSVNTTTTTILNQSDYSNPITPSDAGRILGISGNYSAGTYSAEYVNITNFTEAFGSQIQGQLSDIQISSVWGIGYNYANNTTNATLEAFLVNSTSAGKIYNIFVQNMENITSNAAPGTGFFGKTYSGMSYSYVGRPTQYSNETIFVAYKGNVLGIAVVEGQELNASNTLPIFYSALSGQ